MPNENGGKKEKNEGLSIGMRGLIESSIDELVNETDSLLTIFIESDIEPTEEAFLGYVLGSIEMMVQYHYNAQQREVKMQHLKEILSIIKKRKPQLLKAFREAKQSKKFY